MSKHTKRRNAGLLYEFLVRTISRSLVEGDKRRSTLALSILKRHFRPDSELYKEFRLINAMVRTTVSSDQVAYSILSEAKQAATTHDRRRLDTEKTALVRDIVRSFKDDVFEHNVSEYRYYATAQVLLNEWRKMSLQETVDLSTVAQFEDTMVKWLTTRKDQPTVELVNEESSGTNRVLMHFMMKRLNEKYSQNLSPNQTQLLRSYAFSTIKDDDKRFKSSLSDIRKCLVEEIDRYMGECQGNEFTTKKLVETRGIVMNDDPQEIDDSVITRHMSYIRLCEEIDSSDDQPESTDERIGE